MSASVISGRQSHTGGPDSDTRAAKGTRQAVVSALASVIRGVDAVLDGDAHLPFCCVRPPGHHVGRDGHTHDAPSQAACSRCSRAATTARWAAACRAAWSLTTCAPSPARRAPAARARRGGATAARGRGEDRSSGGCVMGETHPSLAPACPYCCSQVPRGLLRDGQRRRRDPVPHRPPLALALCFGSGAKVSVARAPQTEGAPQPCAAVRPAVNSSRTWHALRASTCTQAQLQARHRCCSFVCGTRKVLEITKTAE